MEFARVRGSWGVQLMTLLNTPDNRAKTYPGFKYGAKG